MSEDWKDQTLKPEQPRRRRRYHCPTCKAVFPKRPKKQKCPRCGVKVTRKS